MCLSPLLYRSYIIQKMMGPLTPEQNDAFFKNPRFAGYKFPDMSRPTDSLDKRYGARVSKHAINFMKSLLMMDPTQRLNGQQCLDHP